MHERYVTVSESGNGPYGQFITSGHHVLGADEPMSLGGQDTGPDPYELVLAGLGGCTAMTIRMYAKRKNIALTRIEVRLRHVQRAGRDIRDSFERQIALTGDLSLEERQRLLEIAERCPVSQTLQRSSEIRTVLVDDAPLLPEKVQ
jgi:putative redox protein